MDPFKKITPADYGTLKAYLDPTALRACDYSPGNLVLWADVYETSFAIAQDTLFIRFKLKGETCFAFPIGTARLEAAFDWLRNYCTHKSISFKMNLVEPVMFERIEAAFPGRYKVVYIRDNADYIYQAADLANFAGKRYHSKKNHVNEFMRAYPDWCYEPITDENTDACIEMIKAWCVANHCCSDKSKAAEVCVVIKGLQNRVALGLSGGVLRAHGRIVALALGERMGDTLIEHFEKAFSDVPGAYPMICQQFVRNEAGDAVFVNREDDMGVEGLRRSKKSYRPAFLANKGLLIPKTGGTA